MFCATADLCATRWSAKAAGCSTLVFTVDMPTPGARYRDAHSGMSGQNAALRRYWQAVTHPQWAWDVGLNGRPHDLGNISTYLGKPTGLEDYIGWLANNFDPSISWKDLEWIREFWDGPMVIKGSSIPKMRGTRCALAQTGLWYLTTAGVSLMACSLPPVHCPPLPMR
jgi:isopentenyl diphosphate isomerase/L-lactate dehydrogenase-like FMN-dependent dehydrogenase